MSAACFVAGDGCRLAYRLEPAVAAGAVSGSVAGPGAPVLMLANSLGATMDMWAPQLTAMTSYRILRFDTRGHGQSEAPLGAYSLDRLGRDALELLDHLGLERVTFCGLSMGGMVGQWLGYRAPERLTRLILCNTSAYLGPPHNWEQRIGTVREGGMAVITDAVIGRWFTPEFAARSPGTVARIRSMLLATPPHGYAGCCAAIRDLDLRPVLPLIATPTLIVGGDRDPATPPAHQDLLAAGIRDSRRVTLPAAHLSNVECPAEFTAAVLAEPP